MVFSFLAAFMLAITIPVFAAGFGILSLAYLMPFVIYVVLRNGKVSSDQKVFTPGHIANWLANLGKRNPRSREIKQAWQMGPAVDIAAVGPLQAANQQELIEGRQSPAYVAVKYLLADAINQRTEKIMLEYTANAIAVRYLIDGVWQNVTPKVHDKQPLDRALGDSMLLVLKRIAHLNGQDRRTKQEGKLRVEFEGTKWDTTLQTQGTPTGERAVVGFTIISKTTRSLEDLGMRDKQREQLNSLIGVGNHGIVVFAALPGDGLTATWVSSLRGTDRLMRDFVSIEDVKKREPEVENVDVQKFDSSKGETPEGLLPKLIIKQPEVICVPDLASGDALTKIAEWIKAENKLSLMSLRAKDASDAVLRLLALKTPPDTLAPVLKGVVYSRLLRRLCEVCREAVQPTPELLQRLGIPAGRVQTLYREKQPLQPGQEKKRGQPEICPACKGLGYKGRIAIFEILTIDDKFRQAIIKQPNVETFRKVAKAAGHRGLQEEGVLLVATGVTSLAELQRALKQ
jgi:type II secretory ATPase GspE/PulE/Tfp pilus assembly ATPase PilB-like protein